MHVGKQIAKIRKLRRMSLVQLSKLSGVQTATICRIENEKMTGTLESHIAMAKALNVELVELYKIAENEKPIDPKNGQEIIIPMSDGRSSQEILAHQVSDKKMLPALLKIEPKGATPAMRGQPGSERFVYVLEGTVEVQLKSQNIELAPRTSLYFNASGLHSIKNIGNKIAKVISVMTPVEL